MSYILEALKKAQAERARGTVPDIEAHPLTPPAPEHARRPGAPLLLGGAALVLGVAIALTWWSFSREAAPGVRLTGDVAPKAAVVRETSAPPHAPAASSDAVTPSAAKPAPAAMRQATPAAAAKAPSAAPTQTPGSAMPAPHPSVDAPRVAANKPPAAEKPEQIALLQDLPPQIQREIPTMAINGYIYASNPGDRSVLINNRLRREGDQVAPGLTLEKLLPKEMVLNYRGYRYRIAY